MQLLYIALEGCRVLLGDYELLNSWQLRRLAWVVMRSSDEERTASEYAVSRSS